MSPGHGSGLLAQLVLPDRVEGVEQILEPLLEVLHDLVDADPRLLCDEPDFAQGAIRVRQLPRRRVVHARQPLLRGDDFLHREDHGLRHVGDFELFQLVHVPHRKDFVRPERPIRGVPR
jgi:hypothetical protein